MGSNSQRGAVVGTMRTDVGHKISKLEAESRQLCLNLKNLHKNRAKLTNEAVALSQELEGPAIRSDRSEEAMHSDPDCIHVLLDANHVQKRIVPYNVGDKCPYEESFRNDRCTICTCSECDNFSEVTGEIEEKDVEESSRKQIYPEEPEGPECCYICYRNGTPVSRYINKSATAVASRDVNEPSGSREKLHFCSTCSVEGRACSDRCEICDRELDDDKILNDSLRAVPEAEERFRGGMDRVEINPAPAGEATNERTTRVCEGCECNLCALRNVEGASPPCLMMCKSFGRLTVGNDENTIDELVTSSGDAPAELQRICKVEKLREVLEQLKNRNHALRKMLNDCDYSNQSNVDSLAPEKQSKEIDEKLPQARYSIARSTSGLIATVKLLQNKCRTKDGMILALAEALKKLASSDQKDRILTKLANPCTDDSPIRDLDRSELWKYLRVENCHKQIQRDERCLESVGQDASEESNRIEESSKCGCTTYTEVSPPRDLRIVERIGADGLVITWEPPESGPVNAYEVFVDEQLVARLRTPLRRTEAVLRCLDLTCPRLIEILAIDPTGLGSSTIEKLYDPVRFNRSKAR